MRIYEEIFKDWKGVLHEHGVAYFEEPEWVYARYEYGNYTGTSEVVYIKDDKVFYNQSSHCSCYGLERQWNPEEYELSTFKTMLKSMHLYKKNPNKKNPINELIKAYESDKRKKEKMTKTTNPFKLTEDEILTLRSIQNKMHNSAKAAGWHNKPREAGTDCALLHSEVSEMMEGFRKNIKDNHIPERPMAEVEGADVFIRLCDTMGKYGFDLASAVDAKHDYNQTRPDHKPENRTKEGGKAF